MQTTGVPVCSLHLFGERFEHFWTGRLSNITDQYPILQHPHKQNFYTLILVEEVYGAIVIDGYAIPLDCTKAIIIKPGCISSITITKNSKGRILCFTEDFFSLRYNSNILNQFTLLNFDAYHSIKLNPLQQKHWNSILELLEQEFQLQRTETSNVLRSYLNIVLHEAERIYNPLGISSSKSHKKDKLERFEELIENHFVTQKTPSGYADMLNISPNYLNKLCKAILGQTAGDVIRRKITIEARRLLHYTNLSINQIADKMGFHSTSYFITFFKRYNGKTPEEYRLDNS